MEFFDVQIMSNNKKDLQMILTVKDTEGKTFDSLESLNFEFKVIIIIHI
jgi:hypothetical protein